MLVVAPLRTANARPHLFWTRPRGSHEGSFWPDYDTLQHIRGMIAASPLTFTGRWIESHQDDKTPLAQIDQLGYQWDKLNVQCDGLAKSYWNTNALADTWRRNLQCGFEKWSLWIANNKLSQIDKEKAVCF
jgi:hypothetical protein